MPAQQYRKRHRHEFLHLGIVGVSHASKHDKACLDCQNVQSVGETTFHYLGLRNESQISQRCKRQPFRSLQHHQRETLLELAVLSVRQHA